MSTPERQSVSSETVRKHKEFLFPAVATYYQEPLALVKGEGFHVWDDQGDKYLDCFGGVLRSAWAMQIQELTKRSRIRLIRSHTRRRFTPTSHSQIWLRSWRKSHPAV